jgi:hypothetical protein
LGFTVDGGPVTPAWTEIADLLHAFEITAAFPAGEHALRIGPAGGASGEEAACSQPWLLNVAGQLSAPALPALPARPLARFTGAEGDRIDLLAAQIAAGPAPGPGAGEPQLLTVWRVDASHPLADPAGTHPTLYVHFEDAQGKRLAQSDHLLAADSFWLRDAEGGAVFVDFTSLPEGPALPEDARARIGLWYPDSRTYYWASESDRTTADGRTDLGTVEQLKMAGPSGFRFESPDAVEAGNPEGSQPAEGMP